jgi:hypothetical protein
MNSSSVVGCLSPVTKTKSFEQALHRCKMEGKVSEVVPAETRSSAKDFCTLID